MSDALFQFRHPRERGNDGRVLRIMGLGEANE
jgi:hypothetical protein